VIAEAGDRSSCVHALVVEAAAGAALRARARPGRRDLAIASASHLADDAQLAPVRALLEKAPATVDDLECGPRAKPPSRSTTTAPASTPGCSPLPCQRLAERGLPPPDHPVQRAMLAVHAEAAEVGRGRASDRHRRLRRRHVRPAARAHGTCVRTLRAARRRGAIADAMREHPELIRGPLRDDTRLMRAARLDREGRRRGLLCAAGHGVGVALKRDDGNGRALGPAAAAFFARLDLDLNALSVLPLENSRNERVGEIRI
jgi:L-asparaginase II